MKVSQPQTWIATSLIGQLVSEKVDLPNVLKSLKHYLQISTEQFWPVESISKNGFQNVGKQTKLFFFKQ